MASNSYIVAILRILAALDGRPITLLELAHRLLHGGGGRAKLPVPRFTDDRDDPGVRRALAEKLAPLMRELAELKVIWLNDGAAVLGAPPPGNLPPAPPDGAGGAGDGAAGSGLGQVLAHPILFSYSEEDLGLTLDAALEEFE